MSISSDTQGNAAAAQSTRGFGKSFFSSSAGILLSRISGLLRDSLTAAYWGATEVAQAAYKTAFAIPNSLRELFCEGAFSSAFVPMISAHIAKDGRESAWRLANRAITLQLLALVAVTLLFSAIAGIFWASRLFAWHELTDTTLKILPILMPFAVLICVSGALCALLNCLKIFFLSSLIQVVFNLVQIASVIALHYSWKRNEPGALLFYCGSTILAGFLQFALLLYICRKHGYTYRFDLNLRDSEVRLFCSKLGPGVLGSGLQQINSLIDKAIGNILGSAAIGALYYSNRLVFLPIGLFGVTMSTVCLPALSRAHAQGDAAGVVKALDYALRNILFLALPATALLMVCDRDIILLLFARGAFNEHAIQETHWALMFYLVGLPAFCCHKVATNPFHARLDTATPVRVASAMLLLNVVLNFSLMWWLRQGGLTLATSICSWLGTIILLRLNRKVLPQWTPAPVLKALLGLGAASACGAVATVFTVRLCANLPRTTLWQASRVAVASASLGAVYLIVCLLLRRPEPGELFGALLRRRRRQKTTVQHGA